MSTGFVSTSETSEPGVGSRIYRRSSLLVCALVHSTYSYYVHSNLQSNAIVENLRSTKFSGIIDKHDLAWAPFSQWMAIDDQNSYRSAVPILLITLHRYWLQDASKRHLAAEGCSVAAQGAAVGVAGKGVGSSRPGLSGYTRASSTFLR